MHKKAFTIVELAVVITVIGILVSASYYGFYTWRDRVAQSEVKSDLNGVHAAMESARNWSKGYPDTLTDGVLFNGNSETKDIFTQSPNVTLTYRYGDGASYCIDGVSKARPSVIYKIAIPPVGTSAVEPVAGQCS